MVKWAVLGVLRLYLLPWLSVLLTAPPVHCQLLDDLLSPHTHTCASLPVYHAATDVHLTMNDDDGSCCLKEFHRLSKQHDEEVEVEFQRLSKQQRT